MLHRFRACTAIISALVASACEGHQTHLSTREANGHHTNVIAIGKELRLQCWGVHGICLHAISLEKANSAPVTQAYQFFLCKFTCGRGASNRYTQLASQIKERVNQAMKAYEECGGEKGRKA